MSSADIAILEEPAQAIEAIATPAAPIRNHAAEGVAFAAIGFAWWGSILPIYIWIFSKRFAQVSALEIFAHRIIWGLPILALMITHRRDWRTYINAFTHRPTLTYLGASTVLIAINWLTYTWAVGNGHLSEASLGYYINPLVSVALGMIFLGERARPMQWVAFALAGAGVVYETFQRGGLPWVSLTLAFSFGFYGLVRKKVKAEATVGLAVETTLLFIPSVALLVWLMLLPAPRTAAFLGADSPWWVTLGVTLSGFMTVVPLVCYTAGARRLRLATVGFLQYIAPTGQFILAVTMFGEPFTVRKLITFVLIWAGLVVFSVDSIRAATRARQ